MTEHAEYLAEGGWNGNWKILFCLLKNDPKMLFNTEITTGEFSVCCQKQSYNKYQAKVVNGDDTWTSSHSGLAWTTHISFMAVSISCSGNRPSMMATPFSRPIAASLLIQYKSKDCTICTSPPKCRFMWLRQAAQMLCNAFAATDASWGCCRAKSRLFSIGSTTFEQLLTYGSKWMKQTTFLSSSGQFRLSNSSVWFQKKIMEFLPLINYSVFHIFWSLLQQCMGKLFFLFLAIIIKNNKACNKTFLY